MIPIALALLTTAGLAGAISEPSTDLAPGEIELVRDTNGSTNIQLPNGTVLEEPGVAAAPPGLSDQDPWVDANGDEMFGDLDMGPNAVRLNGRALAATVSGNLQFDGEDVCLEAGNCEGTAITGLTPIEVDGSTVSLSNLGCVAGEVWKWSGSSWSCEPDADTQTTSLDWSSITNKPAGFADDVDDVGIETETDPTVNDLAKASLSCASGQVAKFDGSTWACGEDVDTDTTYDGSDFALSDQACASGEVVAGVDASGAVVCTTVETSDSDTLAELGCASDEIARFDGSSWVCSVDQDTTYDGSDFALSDQACASGEVVAGVDASGAVSCVTDQDTDSDTLGSLSCSAEDITRFDGSSWVCSVDQDTTYDGSDFAFSDQACASGEVVAGVDASGAVSCVIDQDTTYDGSDFALSGQSCSPGDVVTGVDASGNVLCDPDEDTLGSLFCGGGETVRRNATTGEWECASAVRDTVTISTSSGSATVRPAAICPVGQVDGPNVEDVGPGAFFEADHLELDGTLDNCGAFDWYFRIS